MRQALQVMLMEQAAGLLILTALITALAVPVMKWVLRDFKLAVLTKVAAWAVFRVMVALVVLLDLFVIFTGIYGRSMNSIVGLGTLGGVGWLISRDIKKLGVEKPFPGVGARVAAGIFVEMWVLVIVGFAVIALLHKA